MQAAFIDLDLYLVNRAGRAIAEIVAGGGWPEFRRLETEALAAAVMEAGDNCVIATGGGVVLAAANCEFMKSRGTVIWLDASLQSVSSRLKANPDNASRPGLTGKTMLEELAEVYAARRPIYENSCSISVNADNPVEKVCRDILDALKSLGK